MSRRKTAGRSLHELESAFSHEMKALNDWLDAMHIRKNSIDDSLLLAGSDYTTLVENLPTIEKFLTQIATRSNVLVKDFPDKMKRMDNLAKKITELRQRRDELRA